MLITSPNGDKFIECNEEDAVVQYLVNEDWSVCQTLASLVKQLTGWTLEFIETDLENIDAACRSKEGESIGLLNVYTLPRGQGFKILYFDQLKHTIISN